MQVCLAYGRQVYSEEYSTKAETVVGLIFSKDSKNTEEYKTNFIQKTSLTKNNARERRCEMITKLCNLMVKTFDIYLYI